MTDDSKIGPRFAPVRRVLCPPVDMLEQKIEYGAVVIAQVFDSGAARSSDRRDEVARLRLFIQDSGTAPGRGTGPTVDVGSDNSGATGAGVAEAGDTISAGSTGTASSTSRTDADTDADGVPVLDCLRSLLPGGVLQRGSVVAVPDRVAPWPARSGTPSYLALALSAGASAAGAWCAAVGLPALGVAAVAGLGADLRHLLLLDDPGERWAEAVAVLAGAVDLILVRPPGRPSAEHVRRITARLRTTARQRGSVLIVAGAWSGAHVTLRTTKSVWSGLGDGTGHLTGRRVTVVAEGRGTHGRSRTAQLWLPAADGSAAAQRGAVATDVVSPDGDAFLAGQSGRFGSSASDVVSAETWARNTRQRSA